ncbi:unnamed protein product [Arabidopsis thaliana]|uniref:Uncharacterized protein n=1 Tax=Arabidopsis thaliana TaxID=3702 RepID=A0A5S9WJI0_ARATH|nr:unnamed protein product [Arabidopsis thaliana]
MSLVRCLSLRSVLNPQRYRSSYSFLIHLQNPREEEEVTRKTRSYHSIIHQNSLIGASSIAFSRNRSVFQSPATISSDRFISTFNFSGSGDAVIDWLLQSVVSRSYELHNVADVLVGVYHRSIAFDSRITVPVMVDMLNNIAKFFKSLRSNQGEVLDKVSFLNKSRGVMYTMLEKEFFGVKGSVIGQGIQVPIFWFSMGELKQNMVEILMSRLRGKILSAELIKNGVLSRGRLVVVVGDGFGIEIQMFDLDFSLILRRRQVSQSYV